MQVRWLGVFVAIGMVLAWLIFERIRFGVVELQISFAREQVELFSELSSNALATTDVEEVRKIEEYIKWYYPSGTKQVRNSKLDVIVETARRDACRRIDEHLIELQNKKEGRP